MSKKHYVVVKGIPIPELIDANKYSFSAMLVGDSFTILNEGKKSMHKVLRQARKFCKENNKPWKFSSQVEGDKIRIWRVK